MVVSFELDPLTGVWEIVCGSAAGCPIVLSFCVKVAKMYIFQDPRAQVDILSSFWQVISENLSGQKYMFLVKIRPSEVKYWFQ